MKVFQRAGEPAEAVAAVGAVVEYATDAFRTLAIADPLALNKRSLSWNLLVAVFLLREANVSVYTVPLLSLCPFTEWRVIVELSEAQLPRLYHLLQVVPYCARNWTSTHEPVGVAAFQDAIASL